MRLVIQIYWDRNMSYTLNENGIVLTETRDGVTMPVDCSFEKVNDWIHGIDVQFEELQALCLGMSAENDRLRDKLKHSDDWNESLGAAIESAAGALPQGYRLRLDIEKHGYATRLVLPDDTVADVDRETLVDEIEALVEMAIRHSTQPKPLTKEQLYYQRLAD